ncbi:MAG: hypothetical protein ACRCX2_30260 [Paraclostridium sp.]
MKKLAYYDKDIFEKDKQSDASKKLHSKGEFAGFLTYDSKYNITIHDPNGTTATTSNTVDYVAQTVTITDKLWQALLGGSFKFNESVVDGLKDKSDEGIDVKPKTVGANDEPKTPNDDYFEPLTPKGSDKAFGILQQLFVRSILQEIGTSEECKAKAFDKTPDVLELLKQMRRHGLLDDTCIDSAQTKNYISDTEKTTLKAITPPSQP